MTLTKDITAKIAVAFVAVAMVFSAFASSAKAQTTEELQQMINDLLAQVAALQAQLGQGGSAATASVCPYTWTRDLSTGSTGMDVMKLQQFLNSDPDTRVAVSGPGSAGNETEYYGPATAAAVSKFQVKYRSEILSPANLVNPTGYFGPSTRAKANALCVAPADNGDNGSMDEGDNGSMDEGNNGSEESEDTATLSGEADLYKFKTSSASDDELEEGANDAEIAEVEVEFRDGDARITRLDLALEADAANTEKDPWDVFENISLWVDGDKVGEVSADRRDDYLDDDAGTLRISGLDIVGMEDDRFDIVVAATLQDGLDGLPEDWTVEFDAMRFFDADGVATTDTTTGDLGDPAGEAFSIVAAGSDDELIVKTSSNDPDARTLQVEDDKKSDWYNVFTFDLDTDDSTNDITLNTVVVEVVVSSSSYDTLVDDAELVIDGTTIDDVTVTNGNTTTATLTFDVDGDVVIDAGDRVEAELNLRFNSLAAGNEGVTVQGKVTSSDVSNYDAEGADDLTGSQLRGAATGDAHTLRTSGADVSPKSTSAVVTTGDNNLDDYATFSIEVEVTAFEQDVYISTNPATSISYTIEDGAGSTSVAGTRSVTLTSSADEVNNYFEITEGSTETLKLTVTYTPGVANTAARMVLNSITFDDDSTGTGNTKTQTTLPETDYRTDVVTIVN